MNDLVYQAARLAAGGLASVGGLALLERMGDGPAATLRVLTYHRVAYPEAAPWLDPRLISATPPVFAQQMEHLARHYRVVSIQEALDAVERGAGLPPRAVLITFDDAYADFAEHAWPVLRRLRLPVALFVPTAYPGRPERAFWWDRLHWAVSSTWAEYDGNRRFKRGRQSAARDCEHTLRRLRQYLKTIHHHQAMRLVDEICRCLGVEHGIRRTTLDWQALRELSREGVTLGAHTRTHPLLTRLPLDEIRREIAGSRDDLRREISEVLPVFAYPGGALDERVAQVVREAGFRLAFAAHGGINVLSRADPLKLRRTNITRRSTLPLYRLRLLRPAAAAG